MKKIVAISGSLRKESYTTKALKFIASKAPEGYEVELLDIAYLPLLNVDLEENLPEVIKSFHGKVKSADAVLLGEPEYNRSITPPMKNAIDWGTRPEDNNIWQDLPAAVFGCSPSMLGAYGAVTHLRQTMMHVGMITLTQPELYFAQINKKLTESGELTDELSLKMVDSFWKTFPAWIDKHGKSEKQKQNV